MWFADRLQELIAYSNAASEFMFGPGYIEHMFAFKVRYFPFSEKFRTIIPINPLCTRNENKYLFVRSMKKGTAK